MISLICAPAILSLIHSSSLPKTPQHFDPDEQSNSSLSPSYSIHISIPGTVIPFANAHAGLQTSHYFHVPTLGVERKVGYLPKDLLMVLQNH
jgi:hypothetical protein